MVNTENAGYEYTYFFPAGGFKSRIRGVLYRFSEAFSEFSKYIVPAYHHDRCERSVQMRLYRMHKRDLVLVLVGFLSAFGLSLLIGLAGPPITITEQVDGSEALLNQDRVNDVHVDIASGPYIMRTPNVNNYCQQLWLLCKIKTSNTDDELYVKSFQMSVSVDALEENRPIHLNSLRHTHNRTRQLLCEKQDCQEFMVLHLGFLKYNRYIITVKFLDLHDFHLRYKIKEVKFFYIYYNPAFTDIDTWFRFIFLISTFCVACWFTNTLKKFDVQDWSIEQKWITLLLILLLFFNNPIFPLMVLVDSWVPGMLDAFFQETFVFAILLFWLCVYHGLRQNDRNVVFYLPKLFVVGMMWTASISVATMQKYSEMKDHTFDHTVDSPNYSTMKTIFFVMGAIYLVYLTLLVTRAYIDLGLMPFFSLRLKFLTTMMLVVAIIAVITTISRYGIDVLEDNFASRLTTRYRSSVQFMAFYGLLNYYLYGMAYVYSPPSKPSIQDSEVTKDNPTFSMINESDEEVVYGSDTECRRPLNSNANDDSD